MGERFSPLQWCGKDTKKAAQKSGFFIVNLKISERC